MFACCFLENMPQRKQSPSLNLDPCTELLLVISLPSLNVDLLMSGILSIAMFVIFATWYGVFVDHRLNWGARGDTLTVVLVKGV